MHADEEEEGGVARGKCGQLAVLEEDAGPLVEYLPTKKTKAAGQIAHLRANTHTHTHEPFPALHRWLGLQQRPVDQQPPAEWSAAGLRRP